MTGAAGSTRAGSSSRQRHKHSHLDDKKKTTTTQHTQIAAHTNRNTHTQAKHTRALIHVKGRGRYTRTNKVVCTRRGWGSTVFAASFWFCYSFSFSLSLSPSHTRSWLWNTFDRGSRTTTKAKAACRDRIGKQEERRAVRDVRSKRVATRERGPAGEGQCCRNKHLSEFSLCLISIRRLPKRQAYTHTHKYKHIYTQKSKRQ